MALSRQFKALGRIGAVFAGAWAAVGVGMSMLAGGAFVPSLLTYGIMFGAIGGTSGILTALLVAKGESGRRLDEVPTWRMTLWGFLGGISPTAFFYSLAIVISGGPPSVVTPLVILGLLSGGVGAILSGSAALAAKRVGSPEAKRNDELPAGGAPAQLQGR